MKKRTILLIIAVLGLFPSLVLGSHDGSFGSLPVSQTSVFLSSGQSTSITSYPPSSSAVNVFYISNTMVVSASMNGAILNLTGQNSGTAVIRICTSDLHCAEINVTVGGGFVGSISFSPSSLTLNAGSNSSVSVFNSTGQSLYVSANSNSSIASVSLSSTTLFVSGLNAGFTNVTICAQNSSVCGSVGITVNPRVNPVTLGQTNVSLAVGQSASVGIFGSGPFYLGSNTNPSAVSVYVFGSSLNLYGSAVGASTVSVCSSNASPCASAFVNVGSSGTGNLYFITTALNPAPVGNFYSAQLLVSGNPPFSFSINSGSLPSGTTLSSSGLISGTPSTAGSFTFTVRVQDALSRTAFQTFTLQTAGSVLGGLIYNNGTLINDGGTVWITYKNQKSGFANMSAFLGLGYKTSNVINASTASLTNSGYVITNASVTHPWGSWVKSGNTIYFAHQDGLIPVSHYEIFRNNGGSDNMVVAANSWDLARPILPLMNSNDPRLRP